MFAEDASVFFNADELAEAATLNGVAVAGVLLPGYDDATLDGFGRVAGTSPTFTLASSAVPSKPEGLLLQITSGPGAATYRIGNAKHDGSGICTLELLKT